jgi:hypothetical protein
MLLAYMASLEQAVELAAGAALARLLWLEVQETSVVRGVA